MKTAFPALLIMLILLQSGGLFLVFTAEQGYVHQQMTLAVQNCGGGFSTIIIAMDEYLRAKNGSREIMLHGVYYDVKSVAFKGSRVELHLLRDDSETA